MKDQRTLNHVQTIWKTKIHFNCKSIVPNQKIHRIDDTIVSCGQSESAVRFVDCGSGHMIQKHNDIEVLSSYENESINCSLVNNRTLFCGYSSGRIMKVPLDGNQDIRQSNSANFNGTISDMVIVNGQLMTCGSWQSGLKFWDLENLNLTREIADRECRFHNVFLLAKHIIAAVPPNLSKDVVIYDVGQNKMVNKLVGHVDMVSTISGQIGGKILATGGRDKLIKIWDILSGRCLQTIDTGAFVQEVRYSADGKWLAVSYCQPPLIQIFSTRDYSCRYVYSGHIDNSECWPSILP